MQVLLVVMILVYQNTSLICETIPFYSVSFVSFSLKMIHSENQWLWDLTVPDPYGSQNLVVWIILTTFPHLTLV